MYFGFVFTYDNDCSQDLWTRTGKEKAETKSMENIWKIETLSNDMKQHTCTLETTVFSAIWMWNLRHAPKWSKTNYWNLRCTVTAINVLQKEHLLSSRQENYLRSKCVDNSSVTEHHQRQWQQVGVKKREKSDDFLRGVTVLIDTKRYARSLHDIRCQSGKRDLTCWHNDPDTCDCSVHETLLRVQLQNTQDNNWPTATNRDILTV